MDLHSLQTVYDQFNNPGLQMKKQFLLTFFLVATLFTVQINSQVLFEEKFESSGKWKVNASDAVSVKMESDKGYSGKCLRFDINFKAGSGYGGVYDLLSLDLPENYQITFFVKAKNLPSNNFEIKLADPSGDNVWWSNKKGYDFPGEWTKITVRKRNLAFAWGPQGGGEIKKAGRIELIVASINGGKGSVYIDELKIEKLEVPAQPTLPPVVTNSFYGEEDCPNSLFDKNSTTGLSGGTKISEFTIDIDLTVQKEFGGIVLEWDKEMYPHGFSLLASNDLKKWVTLSKNKGKGGKSYIVTAEAQYRYIRIVVDNKKKYESYLKEVEFKDLSFADNHNNLFFVIAAEQPKGWFPRYTLKQQNYFTVTGVSGDVKEGLLNEDGLLETDKQSFSVEPFLYLNDKFYTWNDVQISHSLVDEYIPIPSVKWSDEKFDMQVTAFAWGEVEKSLLYAEYLVTNKSNKELKGSFSLAIRPFQVNPPWQDLNFYGGTAKIESISLNKGYALVNNKTAVIPLGVTGDFGATTFEEGDISSYISGNALPQAKKITDKIGLGSAAFSFKISLKPGEQKRLTFAIPQYKSITPESIVKLSSKNDLYKTEFLKTKDFWQKKLGHISWKVPKELQTVFNSVKSNIGYILINRDNVGIQPGSRSYERSWIRDGALTSAALLKMGLQKEVKQFAEWYAKYLYENGKVPCVVDKRGPDPVPENDSNGEFIYLIYQYYRYTGDKEFIKNLFPKVESAISFIRQMIAERSTEHYKNNPNDSIRSLYGLVPESISHEGYSDKPMHSYWDNFFTLLGLKDAVTMAKLIGRNDLVASWSATRDSFETNLYNSIKLAIKRTGIDYIPGCAEKGDFDATSTTIAVYPGGEIHNLPQPYLDNTFARYYKFFTDRRDGKLNWNEYTPYEMRTIGTFNFSGQTDIVWELIQYFMKDQRPQGWNHWAEVVTRDYRFARFVGDMPHTWCGSDFINAIRAMVVHERESDNSLLIAPGFPNAWYEFDEGFTFQNLPTYYGEINFEIVKKGLEATINITGDIKIPEGGIRYVIPPKFRKERIELNDKWIEPGLDGEVIIKSLPAKVELIYWK